MISLEIIIDILMSMSGMVLKDHPAACQEQGLWSPCSCAYWAVAQ